MRSYTQASLVVVAIQISSVAAMTVTVPVYNGPTVDESLTNIVTTIPLDESGLVLEVADSIVAPDGLGLFVRCADASQPPVTLDALTPFCGYAVGSMCTEADAACGKTVTFALHSLNTHAFFEGRLWTVGELLQSPEGFEIAGYTTTRDAESGAPVSIRADLSYAGPRFFVPTNPQPDFSILNCGQLANDLAIGPAELAGAGGGTYADDSRAANLLALVQRLERDPDTPTLLRASRPISTLARTITIANDRPMEVGCEYGAAYWGAGMRDPLDSV
jgi:hypothetical protein